MKARIISFIKGSLLFALMFVALGIAGRMDYYDALRCEAQNNGEYYRIKESHPSFEDEDILTYYEDLKKQNNK